MEIAAIIGLYTSSNARSGHGWHQLRALKTCRHIAKYNRLLSLCIIALCLGGCGQSPVKDMDGRILPNIGAEAKLIEKTGWIAVNEQAERELIHSPFNPQFLCSVNALPAEKAAARAAVEQALEQNASRLIQSGQLFQVPPGTHVRMLKYFDFGLMPMSGEEKRAGFVQVEILDGLAKGKSGITTADGVE